MYTYTHHDGRQGHHPSTWHAIVDAIGQVEAGDLPTIDTPRWRDTRGDYCYKTADVVLSTGATIGRLDALVD